MMTSTINTSHDESLFDDTSTIDGGTSAVGNRRRHLNGQWLHLDGW
jgi:hypothetical protein